ncbi:MAG: CotH kinase family protein [Oscillospiraceae bacterium]|nr:CotH kinase family protein [Oscillospiraceae bacterium]
MSTHKNIDRICIIAIVICVALTAVLMNGSALGIGQTAHAMGYEGRLFDTDKVHTIDIVIDDWDEFLTTAQSEEYSDCTVVIDGEAYKNVGIRGKGNTSLSTVSSMDSDRYSFKVEFDQYDKNKSYHGLDKLSLNNVIQDDTYMKDYLTYQMMNEFGASAPLCSFAYITVNGEDWGLYLAVEGVEDSFLQRNFGNDYGNLYKPDSMSFGGGRGNGKDFDMNDFADNSDSDENSDSAEDKNNSGNMQGGFGQFAPPNMQGGIPQMPEGMEIPEDFDFSAMENGEFEMPDMGGDFGGFGMGSSDVKLKYSDDNYDSYSNIFNSAKTDITDSDKDRLIASLKNLSEYENLEEVVDIENVIRYFVVHNFVCNGDSYTGSMIHNYYLYEENGKLSMLPWDYNLAYGTFQGGDATGQVNSPIDTPVSGDMSERPMVGWIFSSDEYTEMYHEYFAEFLAEVDITAIIDNAYGLISEYVEKDPTKFCTYEEFEKGVEVLRSFCQLRSESVKGQLDGTIPSTSEGQNADNSALIDASSITLSDMGTMNMGGKGGFGDGMDKGNFGSRGQRNNKSAAPTDSTTDVTITQSSNIRLMANNNEMPQGGFGGMTPPDGFEGMTPPDGFNGEMPDFGNIEIHTDENGSPVMPEGFGDGMPNPENSDNQSDNTQSENNENDVPQGTDNTNSGNTPQNPFGNGREMPNFGGNMQFPQGGSSTQNNTLSYILLGVSVLLLAGGLIFAFKFKR